MGQIDRKNFPLKKLQYQADLQSIVPLVNQIVFPFVINPELVHVS